MSTVTAPPVSPSDAPPVGAPLSESWGSSSWRTAASPLVEEPGPVTPPVSKIAAGLLGLACAAVAIAAFLPWESAKGQHGGSMQPLAFVTLLAAVLGLGLLVSYLGFGPLHLQRKRFVAFELTLAAGVTLISLGDFSIFAVFGTYLTLGAGLAWVVASVASLRRAPVLAV